MIVSSNSKLDGSICDIFSNKSVFCPLKNSSSWNAVYTFMSDTSIGFVRPWHCVEGGGGSGNGGSGNAMLAVVVMCGGMP